jgi:hypothetical protein
MPLRMGRARTTTGETTEHPIVDSKIETEGPPATSGHADPRGDAGGRRKPPGWGSTSVVALLLANLVPLVGVLGAVLRRPFRWVDLAAHRREHEKAIGR